MEQINRYRSPIVLGVLVLFLLLFAFFLLGFQPTNTKIAEQEAEMAQLEQQNSLLQRKIDERQSSVENSEAEDALLKQLPRGDASEQLLLDLREVGTMSDARLKDIGFAAEDTNSVQDRSGSAAAVFPGVKQLRMTALVEGTYSNVRSWLNALQLLPRIINVEAFSFQHSSNSGNIISANVTFTAYFEQPADAPEAAVQAAAPDQEQP